MEAVASGGPLLALPLQRGGLPYLTPQQLNEVLGEGTVENHPEVCFTVSAFDVASLVDVLPTVCPAPEKDQSHQHSPLLQLWDLLGGPQVEAVSGKAVPRGASLKGSRTPPLILTSHKGGPAFGLAATDGSGLTGTTESGRHPLDPKLWAKIVAAVKPDVAVALGQPISLVDGPKAKLRRLTVGRNETWYTKCSAAACDISGVLVVPSCNGMVIEAGEYWPPLPQSPAPKEKKEKQSNKDGSGAQESTSSGDEQPAAVEPMVGQKRDRRMMEMLEPSAGVSDSQTQWCYVAAANMGEPMQVRQEYLEAAVSSASAQSGPRRSVIAPAETIESILLALSCGVSVVESSLPFALAARGLALVLDQEKLVAATRKGDGAAAMAGVEIINLWDLSYELDQRKLKNTCNQTRCFTCERHSRSYIHHLLLLQELNGSTLLALHNVSELVQLFRVWRKETKR